MKVYIKIRCIPVTWVCNPHHQRQCLPRTLMGNVFRIKSACSPVPRTLFFGNQMRRNDPSECPPAPRLNTPPLVLGDEIRSKDGTTSGRKFHLEILPGAPTLLSTAWKKARCKETVPSRRGAHRRGISPLRNLRPTPHRTGIPSPSCQRFERFCSGPWEYEVSAPEHAGTMGPPPTL